MSEDDHTKLAQLEVWAEQTSKNTERILKILDGNGTCGLVTTTALNSQSIKRLWIFATGIFVAGGGAVLALYTKAQAVLDRAAELIAK